MKITEARILMADGSEALYVGEASDMPRLPEWPFLAVHVADLDAARDVLDTLERSRARKRAVKDEDPLPPVGPPMDVRGGLLPPDDPPCPDYADGRHNTIGGAPCLCGYGATPKEQGKARAKGIRESVEDRKAANG